MKILYYGSACDKEWFDEVTKNNAMPYQVAQYIFEMALIEGFGFINNVEMQIHYLYQDRYYPNSSVLYLKSRMKKINAEYKIIYMPIINMPIIKELSNFILGIFYTLKWAIKYRNEPAKIILTPFQYTPLSLGIFIVSKIFKIKRANIFTDLSDHIMKRQKNMIWLKRLLLPYYKKLVKWLESRYDVYILFTKAMTEIVNSNNKPYIIIEGIYNNNHDLTKMNKEKAIMYAGTLSFEYGVKMLIDAFEEICDDSLQLWLFGSGDMHLYINQLCSIDSRIKYFGFRPHEEVFEYEKRATLLINTRNPDDKYTKYSFPSKTFEYMVSGTPLLTTRIEGIPDEYYSYLYIIKDYSVESIKQKIEEILAKPQHELDDFGQKAQQFVLKNKNSRVQANKILNLLNAIIEHK